MIRLDGTRYDPWAVFHCFELRIKNPYKDASSKNAYRPFDVNEQPECSNPNDGSVAVNCRYRSRFVLQFWFEKLSDAAANGPIQTIKINKFKNPMSA